VGGSPGGGLTKAGDGGGDAVPSSATNPHLRYGGLVPVVTSACDSRQQQQRPGRHACVSLGADWCIRSLVGTLKRPHTNIRSFKHLNRHRGFLLTCDTTP
jgi:hypothetical protein